MNPSKIHIPPMSLQKSAVLSLLTASGVFFTGTAQSMNESAQWIEASPNPPKELGVHEVPQFVLLGFDDNPQPGPMAWILDFLESKKHPDGTPVLAAFYTNGKYLIDYPELQSLHVRAWEAGHEIGNHTQNHEQGAAFSIDEWVAELQKCNQSFVESGLPVEAVKGFRTPFLAYNAATFQALEMLGLVHDSSIEEGYQDDQDGTNFLWPYTLHHGSPGNALSASQGSKEKVGNHPGIFEIPIHVFMVPQDDLCETYGVRPGLRERAADNIAQKWGWQWSVEQGKISGLDWNVLEMALLEADEFLAILKYNLDLRRAGNKAPMMVGGHTALFPESQPERRRAIEAFVEYALSFPEVRIVTPSVLRQWMLNPEPCNAFIGHNLTAFPGIWSTGVDSHGSTQQVFLQLVKAGVADVAFSIAEGDASLGIFPYVELVCKIAPTLAGMEGLEIEYQCDSDLLVKLSQSDFGPDGNATYSHYQFRVPASQDWSYKKLAFEKFEQPAWTPDTSRRDSPGSCACRCDLSRAGSFRSRSSESAAASAAAPTTSLTKAFLGEQAVSSDSWVFRNWDSLKQSNGLGGHALVFFVGACLVDWSIRFAGAL
jgi:peptidoglycan/xylan/chitin deacetylase (PgdA/CDA1 family)